jgi:hypothetical protein
LALALTQAMRAAASTMCLLLLAACLPAICVASPPDVATSFAVFWKSAQGQPFESQVQLWDSRIEAPRHDLYASVVWEVQGHPDWQARKQRFLQARFAEYPKIAADIPVESDALRKAIATHYPAFRRLFPDAAAHPPIEMVLAPDFDAKSGVLADGSLVLAFAVDSLALEHANLDILVPHELFHVYHAMHAGIRNDGVMPGVTLAVPLFEEGLATYVSGQLSPGHSDGQLLLQDDLGDISPSRLPAIARRFLADARSKAVDREHPEIFKRWFNAAATPYQADLPNRSGYWLGLQVIRHLRQTYTLTQIADWSPAQAEAHVMTALADISRGR